MVGACIFLFIFWITGKDKESSLFSGFLSCVLKMWDWGSQAQIVPSNTIAQRLAAT